MRNSFSSRRGFSLLELLAVMAIIAVMTAVGLSFSGGLLKGVDVGTNVSNLATLMEQARQAALANDTYVWLGLAEKDIKGRSQLVAIAFSSPSGQASDFPNNLRPITRAQYFNNVGLDTDTYLTIPGVDANNNVDLATSTKFTYKVPALGDVEFMPIEFKPNGEVSLVGADQASSGKRYAGIGLAGGPAAARHHDPAGIQISLLTGRIAVYRP